MGNKNYNNIGEDIKNIVQDAIGSNNFQHLNEDINSTIQGALNEVKKATSDIKAEFGHKMEEDNIKKVKDVFKEGKQRKVAYDRLTNRYYYTNEADQLHKNKITVDLNNQRKATEKNTKIRLNRNVGNVASILYTVFGSVGAFSFGVASIVFIILNEMIQGVAIYDVFISSFLGLTIIFIIMLMTGSKLRKRIKRFDRYTSILNGRSYCMIQELADRTGFSRRYVIKDIRIMIKKAMFMEGHLDDKSTCLMLNKEAYDMYIEASNNLQLRETQSKQISEMNHDKGYNSSIDSKYKVGDNEELDRILKEGNQYIAKIKEANDYIQDVDVSIKLDRMESITVKIFEFIKEHPTKIKELRRFMEYYLPTTIKLLQTYRKFDEELIQGDNIKNAKIEITRTLDTINLAFENLLDDLYEEEAMDISTDISVLETMLMQEGLTEKDFEVK